MPAYYTPTYSKDDIDGMGDQILLYPPSLEISIVRPTQHWRKELMKVTPGHFLIGLTFAIR